MLEEVTFECFIQNLIKDQTLEIVIAQSLSWGYRIGYNIYLDKLYVGFFEGSRKQLDLEIRVYPETWPELWEPYEEIKQGLGLISDNKTAREYAKKYL